MTEPYIIKTGRDYMTATDLHISYDWDSRVAESRHVAGIGTISRLENTSRNKSRVRVLARDALRATGGSVSTSYNMLTITLLDLKKHMKRLRPDDAEAIQALDERIAGLQQQIKDIRSEREALVLASWRRGVPVQSVELVDAAEANL